MSNVQTGTCLQGSRCNYRRIISNVHVTISILGNLQCIIDRIAIVVLFVYILLECLVVYLTPGKCSERDKRHWYHTKNNSH